jgi:hypothetical protein
MPFVAMSHHVRNQSQADVVARLFTRNIQAFVWPRSPSGWITFVTENDRPLELGESLQGFEQSTVLRYCHAQDLYWGFAIAAGGQSSMTYRCDWTHPEKVLLASTVATSALLKLCKVHLWEAQVWEFNRLLALESVAAIREDEPFLKVPSLLGLERFAGLSFAILDRDPERSLSQYPGLHWVVPA